jgi:hypothetical protein
MGKWHHVEPAIMTLSLNQSESFKHLFASTFDAQYVDLKIIKLGPIIVRLLLMQKYVRNCT